MKRRELRRASERLESAVQGQPQSSVTIIPAAPPVAQRLKIADAAIDYVMEIEARKSAKTAARYDYEITTFREMCPVIYMDEVTKAVLYQFMDALKARGNGARTVFNRVSGMVTFLKHCGFLHPLKKHEMPRYTKKVADAYNAEQLKAMFSYLNGEERLTYQFFLGSGAREQEVMYGCWSDIDFVSGVYSIKAKPDLGFTLKDHEERAVPLPDKLLEDLRLHREKYPEARLLFPGAGGKAEGHFLRKLKRHARDARLNCGQCVNKKGLRCDKHPVCKHWELHKFRKMFAFLHHESGVSARTLMEWLGHSDLETTLTYLKIADIRSSRTRTQVNKTFDAFA